MAKINEGDERWIVRELGDQGRNVNSWHWEDKNVFHWAKERLTNLFKDFPVLTNEKKKLTIKCLHNLKGEAILTNRKGKLRPFYELELELKWKGEYLEDGKVKEKASGKILFPEISQDQTVKESEYKVDLKSKNDKTEHKLLKEEMEKEGIQLVFSRVEEFLSEFKAGANVKKESSTPTTKKESNFKDVDEKKERTIIIKETFNSDVKSIFEAFIDERKVSAYTQSKAEIDIKIGGKFKMLNDKIQGEYLNLVPFKEIQKKVRFSDWKEDHYSTVTILIEEDEDGKASFILKHQNLPEYVDMKMIEGIWRENFIQRIGVMFGGLLKF